MKIPLEVRLHQPLSVPAWSGSVNSFALSLLVPAGRNWIEAERPSWCCPSSRPDPPGNKNGSLFLRSGAKVRDLKIGSSFGSSDGMPIVYPAINVSVMCSGRMHCCGAGILIRRSFGRTGSGANRPEFSQGNVGSSREYGVLGWDPTGETPLDITGMCITLPGLCACLSS